MFEKLFGKNNYANILPDKAKELLSAEKNVILLDVRTPQEYSEIHIPNSISLPLAELKYGIPKVAGDKAAEIIVYCQSGMRAASACSQLSAMGYTNVSNMGGINSWPYETERKNQI